MARMDASRLGPDLQRLLGYIHEGSKKGLARIAELAMNHAGATRSFQNHTHHLRGSIRHRIKSEFHHIVQAGGRDAPYAKFVEEGTRRHVIEARRAKTLRFVQNGQLRFAKRVNHPGTRPRFFMRDARDAAENAVHRMMEAEINTAIRR